MNLAKLVLGAAVASLGACATVKAHNPVEIYNFGTTTRYALKTNNLELSYYEGPTSGGHPEGPKGFEIYSCAITGYDKEANVWSLLIDTNCDGTVDTYFNAHVFERLQILRKDDEDFFRYNDLDQVFKENKEYILNDVILIKEVKK